MKMLLNAALCAGLFLGVCGQIAVAQTPHTLQIDIQGNGSGEVRDCRSADDCPGDRIACGERCLAVFFDGESVLLNARPDAPSVVERWLVNGKTPVSHDIDMTQDVTVTVIFQRKTDTEAPVVTVTVNREYLSPGEPVIITSTATDNLSVTDFSLAVNGVAMAATPGSVTLTPPAAGEYVITVSARDAAGNEATATQRCYARGESMMVSLFKAVDVERGISHRDVNHVALLPGTMNAVRTIALPDADRFAFPSNAEFLFSYKDRAVLFVPLNAVTFAVLRDMPYDSVDADAISSAVFSGGGSGAVIGPSDTVLIDTAEGHYAKIGEFRTDVAEWTIQFSSELLVP